MQDKNVKSQVCKETKFGTFCAVHACSVWSQWLTAPLLTSWSRPADDLKRLNPRGLRYTDALLWNPNLLQHISLASHTFNTSLARLWMFSGTGPCGLAHSPAGDAAAADMKWDDPRTERVAAVSKTCDTCLCEGTEVTARRDAFI